MTLALEAPESAPASWENLPLTPEHRALLESAAISAEVAAAAGVYSITTVEQIPTEFASYGQAVVPALAFPYRSPEGGEQLQLRPDVPVTIDGKPSKYLWAADTPLSLNAVRRDDNATMVLIIEGTKQALAAASHAPEGTEVLGMVGCRGWYRDGSPTPELAVCDDRDVVVILDADAATNLEVYTAGLGLADAVMAEGARSAKFVRLTGGKKAGLDDILGTRPLERRAAYLARLIETAKAKPADTKPKAQRQQRADGSVPIAIPQDRPMIFVDGDRWDVINEIARVLRERWNLIRLFNHGDVISQLRGTEMKPLTEGTFLDLIQETAATARRVLDRDGEQVGVSFTWPDSQSIKAVMSRAESFARLDLVARSPFVRPDGSVCLSNGYDEATRTMVVMDEALAAIDVPDSPTPDDIAQARKLILDDWLGDFPFPDEANRANALALVLTPFVRSMMNVVPLAVIDGLAPGVGKNLLVDCILLMFLGEKPEMMGFNRDDDEFRKMLTSAFRSGAEIFIFDEAHHLEGVSLARALTAAFWKDRQLGGNQMLGFPNRATWVAMGNNVRVEGDVFRRVYRIALRPPEDNPEDRPTTSFRHADLEAWTRENRAELLRAALILVRAWFAAGQPHPSNSVAFGSFERWARILGGVLETAGQPNFLDNLKAWRSESNLVPGYWAGHLSWLRGVFGSNEFTASEVRVKLVEDVDPEYPPIKGDLTDKAAYAKALGEAYAKVRDRSFGGLRIRQPLDVDGKPRKSRIGRSIWLVEAPDLGEEESPSSASPIPSGSPESTPQTAETAETPQPFTHAGENFSSSDPAPDDTRYAHGDGSSGGLSGLSGLEDADEVDSEPANTSESTGPETDEPRNEPANRRESDPGSVDLDAYERESAVTLPSGAVSFDIETRSAAELWTAGPEFIRLSAYQQGATVRVTDRAEDMASLLRGSKVIGHNVMGFDLIAFARLHGLDLHQMTADHQVIDTMLTAILADPPMARTDLGRIKKDYSLDKLGEQHFEVGKDGDLKALAKEFGGFEAIPVNDERYVRYCAGDVDLTSRLAMKYREDGSITPYVWREHQVAAIAAQIRMNGFRVDVPLLTERLNAGRARRAELLADLTNRYGLPTTKKDGKPSKSPHATAEGKAAIVQAFTDLGVTLPTTLKGSPSFGKDALTEVRGTHADRSDVIELLELVGSLNGIRSVYETVNTHLVGDRVHPDISMLQASGRWSITEPGLTVMGKRGGKHVEREVFLAEPGRVIISADLSQVDARAVAAWCQDTNYLELFEPGRDSHTEIALAVWKDAGRRDDAKVIGHGWNYGMGLNNLAQKCGSREAAEQFDQAMRERFPKLVAWKRDVAEMADAGVLLDNGFGRKLRCVPGFGWTQGPALLGQSAARDIMMAGLLNLPREIHPYLRAVVHDEIVLSIPEDQADDIERAVLAALTFEWAPRSGDRPVRIEAGLGERRGRNWGHVYEKTPKS